MMCHSDRTIDFQKIVFWGGFHYSLGILKGQNGRFVTFKK